MLNKKSISLLLIVCILFIPTVYATEFDSNNINNTSIEANFKAKPSQSVLSEVDKSKDTILSYFENIIRDEYEKHYDIKKLNGKIISINMDEEKDILKVDLNFEMIKELVYSDASQLPYIKGMKEELKDVSDKKEYELLLDETESKIETLNKLYIGKEQVENVPFSITLPIDKLKTLSLKSRDNQIKPLFINGEEYVSIDKFNLNTEEELINEGKEDLKNLKDVSMRPYSYRAQSYDRLSARNYARKHALNYNTAYRSFAGQGGDCANFVSQCIYNGGVARDNYWKPYNAEWVGARALVSHMNGNGLFWRSSVKTRAFAGSIISWTSYSHVGLVDQNDTITMTYCAHTNDRLSSSFRYISDVEFYIPEWDSVAGRWSR